MSSNTASFRATATTASSSKPKSYEVRIFVGGTEEAERLKGRVRMIGGMDFTHQQPTNFIWKLRYNARRVGADAVILLRDTSRTDWMQFSLTTIQAVRTFKPIQEA